MRNLFLVLVLANLAFAAWQSWFSPEAVTTRALDGDVPSIMLAREFPVAADEIVPAPVVPEELRPLDEDAAAPVVNDAPEPSTVTPARPADAPAAAPGDAAVVTTCVSVGPFRELSQAAAAAATLRDGGFDPVQRAGEGDIWVGYWVYIAAIPTVAEAEKILARLGDSGITDAYVIPNSDSGNLVSLGVFTEIGRAGNRLAAVRKLGYEATISDRTRRATVYWVDVLIAAGQTLDFEALQPPGRIVRLEQRPCAETLN
jgi:hypothetical protein